MSFRRHPVFGIVQAGCVSERVFARLIDLELRRIAFAVGNRLQYRFEWQVVVSGYLLRRTRLLDALVQAIQSSRADPPPPN